MKQDQTKRQRDEWTRAGLCNYCGFQPVVGFAQCPSHLKKGTPAIEARKASGLCIHCSEKAVAGRNCCKTHLEKASKAEKNRKNLKKAAGICVSNACEEAPAPGRVKCVKHLETTRQYNSSPKIKKQLARYKKTIKGRFKDAKSQAKLRGRAWEISFEDYERLLNQPCRYCRRSILNKFGIGLDRLDNSRGYCLDNVVPCCGYPCNRLRSNYFSVGEMGFIGITLQEVFRRRAVAAEEAAEEARKEDEEREVFRAKVYSVRSDAGNPKHWEDDEVISEEEAFRRAFESRFGYWEVEEDDDDDCEEAA